MALWCLVFTVAVWPLAVCFYIHTLTDWIFQHLLCMKCLHIKKVTKLQDLRHKNHCANVGTKPMPCVNLQLILKTICVSLIVLFTQSVSEKLSFGKSLSAAAVWSSPPPCYFSAVSVILWIMAQTPMQCDRVFPLRFPNQVSSSPPSPSLFFLPSHRTSVLAENYVLKIQGCVCFGRGPIASSFCPLFPYGMVAAKQLNRGQSLPYLKEISLSFHHFINCRR